MANKPTIVFPLVNIEEQPTKKKIYYERGNNTPTEYENLLWEGGTNVTHEPTPVPDWEK